MAKHQLLKEEEHQYLEDLQKLQTRLVEVSVELKEAIAKGDLSENADYTAALNEKYVTLHSIDKIEEILSNYEVVEYNESSDVITIGSKIKLSSGSPSMIYLFENLVLKFPDTEKFITLHRDEEGIVREVSAQLVVGSNTEIFKPKVWVVGEQSMVLGSLDCESGVGKMIVGSRYGIYHKTRELNELAREILLTVEKLDG